MDNLNINSCRFIAEKDTSELKSPTSSNKIIKNNMDNIKHNLITSNSLNELKQDTSLQSSDFPRSHFNYCNSKLYSIKSSPILTNTRSPGYESINISDLITEKTIYLESSNNNAIPVRSTFEPNEITGRSTSQYNNLVKPMQNKELTVEEILASSFSGNVRNLRESLKELNKSYLDSGANSSRYSSLPKTAEMSRNSFFSSFSSEKLPKADESGFSSENFVPSELMGEKLELDEIAWQNQYATIPKRISTISESLTNSENYSNSKINNSNLSVLGNFFQQRSESISNMIGKDIESPNRSRPHALVDETIESHSSYLRNQYVENKTYTKPNTPSEKKDSTNFKSGYSEKENLLSLSTLAKAISNMNGNDDLTEHLRKEKSSLRWTKSEQLISPKKQMDQKNRYSYNYATNVDLNESNKENETPKNDNETQSSRTNVSILKKQNLCDTLEFDESIFNIIEKKSIENSLINHNQKDGLKRKRLSKSPILSRNDSFHESVYRLSSAKTPTKNPNSVCSSFVNSPQSLRSSSRTPEIEKLSPNRRFWLESNCTKSPELSGKLSLPNFPVISKQTSVFRSSSQCSSSSEFSHHSGKPLPIKVCSTELCWGSIKLRKTDKKSVKIKNFSSKRLILRVAVSGPGFQITNMDDGSNLIKLDAQECRTVTIKFCPTTIGLAIGTLSFTSPQDVNVADAKNIVNLCGYGGHSKMMPKGTLLGPVGSPFITLGEFRDLSQPLVKHFSVNNKGSLDGFVVVELKSDNFDFRKIFEYIEVEPKKAIIPADGEIKFRITFKPPRNEIKKMLNKLSPVMTMAHLKLYWGDEATRHRIRKIINESNSNENNLLSNEQLNSFWDHINGENNRDELKCLKETAEVVMDLVSTVKIYNISLTLNHSVFDDSMLNTSTVFPDADETILYRTMLSECSPRKEQNNSVVNIQESWEIRPTSIVLDSTNPRHNHTIFTIKSFYKTNQYFEIACNQKNLYLISPSEGQLSPGESVDINVTILAYQGRGFNKQDLNITIYIENEKIVLPVTIKKYK